METVALTLFYTQDLGIGVVQCTCDGYSTICIQKYSYRDPVPLKLHTVTTTTIHKPL